MKKNDVFHLKLFVTTVLCSAVCVACSSGGGNAEPAQSNLDLVEAPDNNTIENAASETIDTITPSTPVGLPGEANAAVEYAAHLYIAQTQGPIDLQINASARFHQFATPLDDAPVLQVANNLDTCEIGSEDSQLNAESLDLPIDHIIASVQLEPIQTTTLSAGQSIELDSNAGSYLSLVADASSADVIEYTIQQGVTLNVSVPAQLNIVAPGDAFPALQWQWSTPELLDAELRAAVRSLGTNPTLVWQAPLLESDSSQSKLFIHAGSINELTGERQSFQCELADDGEFTMPDDVLALYASGFNANFVDVVRTTRTLTTVANTSIVNVFVQQF